MAITWWYCSWCHLVIVWSLLWSWWRAFQLLYEENRAPESRIRNHLVSFRHDGGVLGDGPDTSHHHVIAVSWQPFFFWYTFTFIASFHRVTTVICNFLRLKKLAVSRWSLLWAIRVTDDDAIRSRFRPFELLSLFPNTLFEGINQRLLGRKSGLRIQET